MSCDDDRQISLQLRLGLSQPANIHTYIPQPHAHLLLLVAAIIRYTVMAHLFLMPGEYFPCVYTVTSNTFTACCCYRKSKSIANHSRYRWSSNGGAGGAVRETHSGRSCVPTSFRIHKFRAASNNSLLHGQTWLLVACG